MNRNSNNTKKLFITSLFILLLSWAGASADVLNVPSKQYKTIQSAIDDAFPGDRIVIAEGRFEEHLSIPKGGLEIVGAGVDKTVIVVSSNNPVINYDGTGGSTLTISGLSIEGGYNGINAKGGPLTLKDIQVTGASSTGIYCEGNASYTVERGTVTDVGGYGVYCRGNSFTFSDGLIERTANHGIYIRGGNPVTLNTITVNRAGVYGIAIDAKANAATLNTITINRAENHGIYVGDNTSLSLTNGMITRSKGNGIHVNRDNNNVIVRRSIITVNAGIGVGIETHNKGEVNLGTEEDPGNNEIYQNGKFNVWGVADIDTAIGNWWGTASPQPEQFSGVTYEPFLTEPPISSFPMIRSVEPPFVSVAGGTLIQITGERFVVGATVAIGGELATSVIADSETQITAVTPAGIEGPAKLTVTNPDGGTTSMEEAFTYVDIAGGTTSPSDSFKVDLTLAQGINIFALPLRPEQAVTASQLAADLEATIVLRAVDSKFQVYVPEGNFGVDFPLEVGKGVIVNLLASKDYSITGRPWGTAVPAAPVLPTDETWAFVVAGNVAAFSVPPHFTVRIVNIRTGQSIETKIDASGRFTAAFVDMSKRGVVVTGDEISLRVYDNFGNAVGREQRYRITPENLARAYLLANISPVPATTQLLQNYPNPFNPETWIPFHLAEDADVTMKIYDVKGNVVRKLFLGTREAGIYTTRMQAVYWDGRNNFGESVSTGVYFYTLKAGDFRMTRRMVVVK